MENVFEGFWSGLIFLEKCTVYFMADRASGASSHLFGPRITKAWKNLDNFNASTTEEIFSKLVEHLLYLVYYFIDR